MEGTCDSSTAQPSVHLHCDQSSSCTAQEKCEGVNGGVYDPIGKAQLPTCSKKASCQNSNPSVAYAESYDWLDEFAIPSSPSSLLLVKLIDMTDLNLVFLTLLLA